MTDPAPIRYRATDGAAYEIFLGRWSARLAPALVDFAGFYGEGPVLDLGCGTGSLAATLAARRPAADVLGIDRSPAYVAFAAQRPDCRGVAFAVGDAVALPIAEASVGGAAAQLVLNFVAVPERALAELRRVVRPGGTIAAAVWDFRGGLVYQRLFWDTAAMLDAEAAMQRDRLFAGRLALPDGLPQLFAAAGLRDIERASLTIRMDYASFEDYWAPLLGGQGPVGSYAASLDPALRARIREAVQAAFLSGAPDGPRSLTASAWAVRGVN